MRRQRLATALLIAFLICISVPVMYAALILFGPVIMEKIDDKALCSM